MRKLELPNHLDVGATADTNCRRRPFADTINRHDRRLLERRRIKRRRRMRLVMLAEQDLALESLQMSTYLIAHPELFRDPKRQGHEIRPKALGRICRVRLEQAIKLEERFF